MWDAIKDILEKVVSLLAAFLAGKIEQKKTQAENDAEQYKNEAKRWADMPAGDDDFKRRLQERIDRKRAASDKPDAG